MMKRNSRKNNSSRGFTLPELLVAGALFGILALAAVILIRPVDYEPVRRNAERWAGAAQLAHAISKYAAQNGGLPEGVGSEAALIGTDEEMLDLCEALTPKYLDDLPVEPEARLDDVTCQKQIVPLITGYAVREVSGNAFEVSAPLAENGEEITVRLEF